MEKIHIKVNAAGNKAIQELLDIALKTWGLQALNWVVKLLQTIDIDEEFFAKKDKEEQEAIEKAQKENKADPHAVAARWASK